MTKNDGLKVRVSYKDVDTIEPERIVWVSRQFYNKCKKEVNEMNVGLNVLRKQFPDTDSTEINLSAYIVFQVLGDNNPDILY